MLYPKLTAPWLETRRTATIDKMNNTQSHMDTENNLNCHDSLGYSKPKPGTLSFAIDTIQGVNGRGPNLHDRGNDANNEHPIPSRNTNNQSTNFRDSRNIHIPA